MNLLEGQGGFLISLALLAFGLWWLIPRAVPKNKWVGLAAVLLGILGQLTLLRIPANPIVDELLFALFSGSALLFGVLSVTHRKPVIAALWFALATLATCGLLLLQSAPFLAAATIIVYAGAIVVTFVFVIMLAQQAGATPYDQRSRQPALAVVVSFVLLAAILTVLLRPGQNLIAATPVAAEEGVVTELVGANPLSQPLPGQALGTLHGLGRSLFGDYLYFVELAGTLLMIASIGAIAIAPRREQGTL